MPPCRSETSLGTDDATREQVRRIIWSRTGLPLGTDDSADNQPRACLVTRRTRQTKPHLARVYYYEHGSLHPPPWIQCWLLHNARNTHAHSPSRPCILGKVLASTEPPAFRSILSPGQHRPLFYGATLSSVLGLLLSSCDAKCSRPGRAVSVSRYQPLSTSPAGSPVLLILPPFPANTL